MSDGFYGFCSSMPLEVCNTVKVALTVRDYSIRDLIKFIIICKSHSNVSIIDIKEYKVIDKLTKNHELTK